MSSDSDESDTSSSGEESCDEIRTEHVGRHQVTEENFVVSKSKNCKAPVIEELNATLKNSSNNSVSNSERTKNCQ